MGMVSIRVSFKREHSPFCEFVDERRHVLHDPIQKSLSFFRAGKVRMSYCASLRDFMKLIDEIHGSPVLHICFAIRIGVLWTIAFAQLLFHALGTKVQHDGCFHLARMGESSESRLANLFYALRSQSPIRSKNKLRLWKLRFQF